MAATKATRLWSALVSALLAFFASLGFIAPQTAAAVPQQTEAGNPATVTPAERTLPAAPVSRPYEQSRPPTMKQRIRAEAHNSSPASRSQKIPRAEARHRADTREHAWLNEEAVLMSEQHGPRHHAAAAQHHSE